MIKISIRDENGDVLHTIYQDGKNAVKFRKKKPIGSNPYLPGTASNDAWENGVKEQKELEGIS